MELIEKPIVGMDEFEIIQIQMKAKGGRICIKWGEHWSENNGSTTWSMLLEKEAPRFINETMFELLYKLADVLAKRAGVEPEALELNVIKFFERPDSVKSYDLGVKFKIAGEKETRTVARMSIADLANQSTEPYEYIQNIVTDMEANAYAFCVMGQTFSDESDAIEIENDGTVNF